jgi:hypothetical protein
MEPLETRPRPRPRPAYRGAKAGLVTTPGPEQEAAADVQAAVLLLGLAGNSNGAQAGQLRVIKDKAVSNDVEVEVEEDFKASDRDSEVDELEEVQVEAAANSPRDFGEFIAIC